MKGKILIFSIFVLFGVKGQVLNPCRGLEVGQVFAPNPRGCSWFFYCANPQEPEEGKCPDGLHLSIALQTCTYADNVVPRCTFDEDLLARTSFECPTNLDMRIIPHPFNCSQYTLCWEHEWLDFDCPLDRPHYSLFDNDCNTELLADCNAVDRFCDQAAVEVFRVNPHTCDDYLMCTKCENDYNLLKWLCPTGYKFSQNLGICVLETGFNCHIDAFEDFTNPPSQPFTYDCSSGTSNFRPHPTDCDLYFICTTQTSNSVLARCPEGTEFDIVQEQCRPIADRTCYIPPVELINKAKIKVTNIIPRIDV